MKGRIAGWAALVALFVGSMVWMCRGGESEPAPIAGVAPELALAQPVLAPQGRDLALSDDHRVAVAPPATPETDSAVDAEPAVDEPSEVPLLEEEGDFHEDPLERGSSELWLSVVDAETHEPVAASAWLVRLDAPGNEFWEHGDQVQARVHVPEGGVLIPRLPEGAYRVALMEQPAEVPDPAPFWVEGQSTEVELELVVHPPRPVRLLVRDAFGPSEATLYLVSADYVGERALPVNVDWITPREPKFEGMFFDSFVGDPDFGRAGRGQPIEANAGVFELGEVRAPTRAEARARLFVLDDPGVSRIEVLADWARAEGTRWAAVQVPLAMLAEAIRLEDGARPDPEKLAIEATCTALPTPERSRVDPCLDAELDITATYPGHEPLHFRWKPASGSLADQYFVRTPTE